MGYFGNINKLGWSRPFFGNSNFLGWSNGGSNPPPTPTPIGVYLGDDFNPTHYSNAGTGMNFTVNTNSIDMVDAGPNFGYRLVNNAYFTGREKNKYTVFAQINASGAFDYGWGPCMMDYNSSNSWFDIILGIGNNKGTVFIFNGGNSPLATASGIDYIVGDIFQIDLELNVNVYSGTFTNTTSPGLMAPVTVSYTGNYGFSTSQTLKVTGRFGFRTFGANVTLLPGRSISTTEDRYNNITILGDSKPYGLFAGTVSNIAAQQLKANNLAKIIINSSCGNDDSLRMTSRSPEWLDYNSQEYWFVWGSNDIRFGNLSYQAQYTALITAALAQGSTVKIFNLIAENWVAGGQAVDVRPYNTWLATLTATFPSVLQFDLYTNSQTLDNLKAIYNAGDNVHPNTLYNTTEFINTLQSAV